MTIRPNLNTNQFVSWPTLRGKSIGRIQSVITKGTVGIQPNFKGFIATPETPVAKILVYVSKENGWEPSEDITHRPVSLLSQIDKPKPSDTPSILIRKKDQNKIGEICVYSDIGSEMWGGISSKMFRSQLDELTGVQRLEVRINSGGGDAFEGLAMHNMIKQFKADEKVAYVDSLCASAATVVALGAPVISMAEESWFMIHRSATFAFGNYNDISKVLDVLGQVDEQLVRIYNAKTSLGKKEIEDMLDAETWMTSDKAMNLGFIDEITEASDVRIAASLIRPWFKNSPQASNSNLRFSDDELTIRRRVAQQSSRLKPHNPMVMQQVLTG